MRPDTAQAVQHKETDVAHPPSPVCPSHSIPLSHFLCSSPPPFHLCPTPSPGGRMSWIFVLLLCMCVCVHARARMCVCACMHAFTCTSRGQLLFLGCCLSCLFYFLFDFKVSLCECMFLSAWMSVHHMHVRCS